MVLSGNLLPFEILLKVFDYVRDNKQRGVCRLVCKSWNPIAERAMLKQVSLSSSSAPKLYNHLVRKPRVAKHIQVIHLYYSFNDMDYLQKIFDLTAPNLKILRGQPYERGKLCSLLESYQTSTAQPLKLEQILIGGCLVDEAHTSLLYLFKETLKSTSFEYLYKVSQNTDEAIVRFPQFKNLTTLKIYDYYYEDGDIQHYENLLGAFVCLETLRLKVKAQSIGNRLPRSTSKAWLSKNVQQDQSLTTLRVHLLKWKKFDPKFLEYLSYKYPNIKHLTMKGAWRREQRIYPIFAHVESFQLKDWWIECLESVGEFANIWKRQSNSVILRFGGNTGSFKRCELNIKKKGHTDHTKFAFDSIDYRTPLEVLVSLLSIFRGSALKNLEIDLALFDRYNTYTNTYPSDFLKVASSVERLKLTARCLHLKERLDLAHLHTVELVNMDITIEDITYLCSSASSLRHLAFTSCTFNDKSRRHGVRGDGIIDITGDQSELPQSDANINQISLIHVFVGEVEHYFFTKPSSSPSVQLPHQEHILYSVSSSVLTIKCKSLQSLKVDLSNVKFDVQFDDEGKIK